MALRRPLAEESPEEAARALDELRGRIGPIGVPVTDFIAEGVSGE